MNKNGKPENLKPFKPGQSGNPGGRPRKRLMSDRYAALLDEPFDEAQARRKLPKGATWVDAIVRGLALAAINGKVEAAREIREGIEGKPRRRIDFADPTLAAALDKMSQAELEAHAADGTMPDWFLAKHREEER